MAEIRLICPSCAAEYSVPDTAIPAEGREVECSACGNVWHALAQPGPIEAAPDLPTETPRLSRRLPDSVLDILRDEVEHERRARAAEDAAGRPVAVAAVTSQADASPAPGRPASDPEWPATTITRHVETRAPEPRPLEPRPVAKPQDFAVPPKSAAPTPAVPLPEPERPPVAEAAAAPLQPAPPSAGRGSYGAGFGLAAMLAAAFVALYVLAPTMADRGTFGEELMQLRGHADEARLWLQDRAATLTR